MTKSEFLRRLEKALAPLGAQERQAALEYWEEYIAEAAEEDGEEAAIANIDAPEDIARRLLAEAGMAPAPRKKRSASYWVLLVMASPIWLSLGAAAFAIVLCALIALALLALTPAMKANVIPSCRTIKPNTTPHNPLAKSVSAMSAGMSASSARAIRAQNTMAKAAAPRGSQMGEAMTSSTQ